MAARHFLEGLEPDRLKARTEGRAPEVRPEGPEATPLRASSTMGPASVLHLQRNIGNAGTTAFLQRDLDEDEGGGLQREATQPGEPSPVHSTIAGSGSPLDGTTRSTMEGRLGADFSDVRLHVDAKSAESVQAAAYTVGRDIVVHPDHFTPGTPQAQRTLAHELTHVIQQRSGPVSGTPQAGGIQVSNPSDHFEQAAERSADSVMSHLGAGHSADEELV
jgi:hypothetical protein